MSLPLAITAGDVGHIADHEEVHRILDPLSDDGIFLPSGYRQGIAAARPAAAAANKGWIYYATDTGVLAYSDGAVWRDQPKTSTANIWTAIQNFDDDAFFRSGQPWADVRQQAFGAVGDGVTDDTAAFNAARAELVLNYGGGIVWAGPGTYIVSGAAAGAAITLDTNVALWGSGPGTTIKAKNGDDFTHVIYATGETGVQVRNLRVDVNQANRAGAMTTVMTGIFLTGCTDSLVEACTVENAIGFSGATGNLVAFGGASVRCRIANCVAVGVSVASRPVDGFYCSGSQMLISGCVARTCTDTAFAVAECDVTGIVGCSAWGCAVGAAIANTTVAAHTDNYIYDVQIYDCNPGTAGISAGVYALASNTGNLINTTIANVSVQFVGGTGPGCSVQETSTGNIIGVDLVNIRVHDATTQGMLVEGERITIVNFVCEGISGSNALRIIGGSILVHVQGGTIEMSGGGFEAVAVQTGCDNVTFENVVIRGDGVNTTYGIYFFGTVTSAARVLMCSITGVSVARVGSDAGTTPFVVLPYVGGIGTESGVSLGKQEDAYWRRSGTAQLATAAAVVIGSGGNEIIKIVTRRVALDMGSVGAGTSAELAFALTGVGATGYAIHGSPEGSPNAGLMWGFRSDIADQAILRHVNATGAPIDPGVLTYDIVAMKIA